MPRFLISLLAVFLSVVPAGQAQVQVHVKMERDGFLLYEPIPVAVGIQNFSGRDLELANQGGTPWLEFTVTDEHGQMIGAAGKADTTAALVVPAGRTVARTVDLIPLFDLRQRGTFRVQARIRGGGVVVVSSPVSFSVGSGRELWRQTVGVRGAEKVDDQSRTYTLLTHRESEYDVIYAGVQDESRQLVYGMLRLGRYVVLGEPEARTDGAGHLHVLYCTAPHSFAYAHIDPQAKIVDRAAYSDVVTLPRLTTDAEGRVAVRGGEKTFPREKRAQAGDTNTPRAVTPRD